MLDREDALRLLHEYTKSESLLKHALAVEAAMLWYAKYWQDTSSEDPKYSEGLKLQGDGEPEEIVPEQEELWGLTGLLHDFDYERYPDPVPPDGHPYIGVKILEEHGYPAEMCRAILGHATYTGVPRDSLLAKTLFAVDELSGLITAAALVRPDKDIQKLEASSVLKRFKDKAFARGCNRDDIRLGAEELGIPLDRHVQHVLIALQQASGK